MGTSLSTRKPPHSVTTYNLGGNTWALMEHLQKTRAKNYYTLQFDDTFYAATATDELERWHLQIGSLYLQHTMNLLKNLDDDIVFLQNFPRDTFDRYIYWSKYGIVRSEGNCVILYDHNRYILCSEELSRRFEHAVLAPSFTMGIFHDKVSQSDIQCISLDLGAYNDVRDSLHIEEHLRKVMAVVVPELPVIMAGTFNIKEHAVCSEMKFFEKFFFPECCHDTNCVGSGDDICLSQDKIEIESKTWPAVVTAGGHPLLSYTLSI